MAITSASVGQSPVAADTRRNVFSRYIRHNAGGPPPTVSAALPENAQGFTVTNFSSEWIRIRVGFDPSITSTVPAADRVLLIGPQVTHSVDFGANNADDLPTAAIEPIASFELDVVDVTSAPPGTPANPAAFSTVTALASPVVVAINFASA
jgi:hypothetical protein